MPWWRALLLLFLPLLLCRGAACFPAAREPDDVDGARYASEGRWEPAPPPPHARVVLVFVLRVRF